MYHVNDWAFSNPFDSTVYVGNETWHAENFTVNMIASEHYAHTVFSCHALPTNGDLPEFILLVNTVQFATSPHAQFFFYFKNKEIKTLQKEGERICKGLYRAKENISPQSPLY